MAERDFLYGELVKVGQKVGVAIDPAPWAAPSQRTYTVQGGDSLSLIAQHYLGDGNRWPEIYKLNQAEIGDNPNLIHPGQVLVLPNE